ncbi:MAG: hypothetical protein HFJ34_07400 [Clostridia bacterium]|nr:hypothetical protein [Clostridia bacterium]
MENQRKRKELEKILEKIRELINSQKGEKNFIQIQKEILTSESMKFSPELTEEEVKEIFIKYDQWIMGGEYSKFLNIQKFKTMMLNWIRSVSPTYKLDRNKIKEEVGKRVAEFASYNDELPEEDIEDILNNYDVIFDEVMELTKGESLILNALKEEKMQEPTIMKDKDRVKQQVKRKIQADIKRRVHFSGENRFTKEVEKVLQDYDLIFDWTYDNFIQEHALEDVKKIAKNALKKDLETSRRTMETIHQKRETFLASIKQQVDNYEEDDNLKRKEEILKMQIERANQKIDKPKELENQLAYMTMQNGKILHSYNPIRKDRKKRDGKSKTIKIWGFMNEKRKMTAIPYPTKEEVEEEKLENNEGRNFDTAWQGR